MSCSADGPLGRPAYAPPTPGSGSSGRGGMRWRGWERRGEIAGGRLVTGREKKEGRRSACAKPRGKRAKRFVLVLFTTGSTGNIEAIARGGGIMLRDRHGR